jgi:glyceraldehyde-3-phosphate dehydrogenase (NADP+)
MSDRKKFLVGGQWRSSDRVEPVIFPFNGDLVAEVYEASDADMRAAVEAAERGFEITRRLPSHRRSQILRRLAELLTARREEMLMALILEGGKPRKVAIGEFDRAVQTVVIASEEARRIGGEVVPIDWTPSAENRFGMVRRFPIGPVLGITPFNYPLNLGCHKLAPAIAAGNSIVLKPAEDTPLSTLMLAEMVLEAGFPPEAFSVIMAGGSRAEPLARDQRFRFLTFTGSGEVGWHLKAVAGRKKVALELGGNAGIIIHHDADLDYAVERCAFGGFTNSGQNCISVQRLIVHERVGDEFTDKLVARVGQLITGDPRHDTTDVGPLIHESAAQRVEAWIKEAMAEGARLLCGGQRIGNMIEPAVLAEVKPEMRVGCDEVFGPVVSLMTYSDFDEAIRVVNNTPYGLQGGIFSRDIFRIMQAFEEVEVGGLQVNDVSTFRVDHMPYGGVKASGIGREGVRYTIEEMTEPKLLVLNLHE